MRNAADPTASCWHSVVAVVDVGVVVAGGAGPSVAAAEPLRS